MKRSTEKTSQLGFAYTTPCLVTGKERRGGGREGGEGKGRLCVAMLYYCVCFSAM